MSDDAEADALPRDASPAPWTVKGMTRHQRDAINAAACRADMTVAAFIWDACNAKIRADRVPINAVVTVPKTELVGHPGDDHAPASRASHNPTDDLDKLSVMAVRLSAPDLKSTAALEAVKRAVAARATKLADE